MEFKSQFHGVLKCILLNFYQKFYYDQYGFLCDWVSIVSKHWKVIFVTIKLPLISSLPLIPEKMTENLCLGWFFFAGQVWYLPALTKNVSDRFKLI